MQISKVQAQLFASIFTSAEIKEYVKVHCKEFDAWCANKEGEEGNTENNESD